MNCPNGANNTIHLQNHSNDTVLSQNNSNATMLSQNNSNATMLLQNNSNAIVLPQFLCAASGCCPEVNAGVGKKRWSPNYQPVETNFRDDVYWYCDKSDYYFSSIEEEESKTRCCSCETHCPKGQMDEEIYSFSGFLQESIHNSYYTWLVQKI